MDTSKATHEKTMEEVGVYKHKMIIDNQKVIINYGSKEEFMRLLKECSLEVVTNNWRHGDTKGYYFKCIHCNQELFSNK